MHPLSTSDPSFDWNNVARPAPPLVLRELAEAAGVRFNGNAPWDIQVFDERVYRMILSHGSLGFGEAYMAGLWDCARLDELFLRLLGIDADERLGGWTQLRIMGESLRQSLLNLQSKGRAFEVGNNTIFCVAPDSSALGRAGSGSWC